MADSILQNKTKPLTKDSCNLLLDMICKKKAITSKSTRSNSNKLKEEAWKQIAQEFSELTGEVRRPEQLRLKWENLKKNARRQIRQNMTEDGKAFMPSNEVLERVTSILAGKRRLRPVTSDCGDSSLDTSGGSENNFTPDKYVFVTTNEGVNEGTQKYEDLGLASYLQHKTGNVELDNKNLELQHMKLELARKKIKLDTRKLELESQRIELETRKLELESKELELENMKIELEIRQFKEKMNCD